MKVYNIKHTQVLPISLEEAWVFFSTPENVAKITPRDVNLKILYVSGGGRTYAGQIMRYKMNVMPGISIHWVNQVNQVSEPDYWVDEQRSGPFAFWHHQHHFQKVEDGVRITDEINYALPFGILGRLAHWLFVGKKVESLFQHRSRTLEEYFAC